VSGSRKKFHVDVRATSSGMSLPSPFRTARACRSTDSIRTRKRHPFPRVTRAWTHPFRSDSANPSGSGISGWNRLVSGDPARNASKLRVFVVGFWPSNFPRAGKLIPSPRIKRFPNFYCPRESSRDIFAPPSASFPFRWPAFFSPAFSLL